jgi:gliding motility-associated-like protein
VAEGNEEYLTIGLFVDTLNFDTLCNYVNFPCDFSQFVTYFYIDNCELIETKEQILIPNVFTPNMDNKNDLFYFNFDFLNIKIFNRWGNKMFETTDPNNFWDGKTNGEKVSDGTYFYVITTEKEIYKGLVQLLR